MADFHKIERAKQLKRIGEALQRHRKGVLGVTQGEIGRAMGWTQSQISKVERGLAGDPREWGYLTQLSLLNAYKLSPADYERLTGESLPIPTAEEVPISATSIQGRALPVKSLASAGRTWEYAMLVDPEYDRPGLEFFRVEGNSMEPTLFDGDVAYCDTNVKELRHGEVYVFHLPGDGYVIKRYVKNSIGWLMSDNPSYAPIRPDEVEVVGLVYHAVGARKLRR